VAATAAAERICGCDGGDDGTREKKGSFLFICVVGCNGPLKLSCYVTLLGLPLDPQQSAEIW